MRALTLTGIKGFNDFKRITSEEAVLLAQFIMLLNTEKYDELAKSLENNAKNKGVGFLVKLAENSPPIKGFFEQQMELYFIEINRAYGKRLSANDLFIMKQYPGQSPFEQFHALFCFGEAMRIQRASKDSTLSNQAFSFLSESTERNCYYAVQYLIEHFNRKIVDAVKARDTLSTNDLKKINIAITSSIKLNNTPAYILAAKLHLNLATYWRFKENPKQANNHFFLASLCLQQAKEVKKQSNIAIYNAYFGTDNQLQRLDQLERQLGKHKSFYGIIDTAQQRKLHSTFPESESSSPAQLLKSTC